MDFKNAYPDFAAIEGHIHRARVERGVYLAHLIAGFVVAAAGGAKRLGEVMDRGLAAERDRRAIEADSFLKRSVSHR
jgi:hypothetical protein